MLVCMLVGKKNMRNGCSSAFQVAPIGVYETIWDSKNNFIIFISLALQETFVPIRKIGWTEHDVGIASISWVIVRKNKHVYLVR